MATEQTRHQLSDPPPAPPVFCRGISLVPFEPSPCSVVDVVGGVEALELPPSSFNAFSSPPKPV